MKLACASGLLHRAIEHGELTQLEFLDLCARELACDGVVLDVRHFPRTDDDYLAQVKKMAADRGLTIAALADACVLRCRTASGWPTIAGARGRTRSAAGRGPAGARNRLLVERTARTSGRRDVAGQDGQRDARAAQRCRRRLPRARTIANASPRRPTPRGYGSAPSRDDSTPRAIRRRWRPIPCCCGATRAAADRALDRETVCGIRRFSRTSRLDDRVRREQASPRRSRNGAMRALARSARPQIASGYTRYEPAFSQVGAARAPSGRYLDSPVRRYRS